MKAYEYGMAGREVEGAYVAYQVMRETGEIRARYIVDISPRRVWLPLGASLPRACDRWVWVETRKEAERMADKADTLE